MRPLKISKQITNRESQSLDKGLQEIEKVDLLAPEQEVHLAKRIREGDQVALEKLTKANLHFVVSVSKQYQNQGLTLGDNEGNPGLIKAAQRFDETRGFKLFISFTVLWIRHLTTAEVLDTMKISVRHVSMDAPFIQGEENSLLDILTNDSEEIPDSLPGDSLRVEVKRALSTLTKREGDVVVRYFGLHGEHALPLEEIGEKFKLTRERVRQIKEKAIRRLRHTSRRKALKLDLG
ncbi:sigma-70 family RNA polymerase sigma factor [Pseudochryseolinea flava]|uniref:RNA polymerase subunit sigma n=1 Tax=Pseudochryseolinea flava TaxID=2059302 RepID=A0A364XV38_9BACT|nr:sigma-70 family RNA polymerase sigma factor [Pseudochryseolinea flava]RAV98028.1 RNA polymerase subunit sigma [Pseudochryseolinea flava]